MANNDPRPLGSLNDPNPLPTPAQQVMALDTFINGSAPDLGGIYLDPETIANALGARYKSEYRMPLTPKIMDTWKRMSDEEMAIRYHNFLKNNPEFPDIFKGDELRDMFTKPSRGAREGQGPLGAYIEVYHRMHTKNDSVTVKSAFNTRYEIPFLISLLNALVAPLPPAAAEHLRAVAAASAASAAGGGGGAARDELNARANGYVPPRPRPQPRMRLVDPSMYAAMANGYMPPRGYRGGARRSRKTRRGRSRKSSRRRSSKTRSRSNP